VVAPLSRVKMIAGYVLGLLPLHHSATILFEVTMGFGAPLRGSALSGLCAVLLLGRALSSWDLSSPTSSKRSFRLRNSYSYR